MANHLLSKMQTERRKKMTQDPVNMIASGKKEFPSCFCLLLWTNNP